MMGQANWGSDLSSVVFTIKLHWLPSAWSVMLSSWWAPAKPPTTADDWRSKLERFLLFFPCEFRRLEKKKKKAVCTHTDKSLRDRNLSKGTRDEERKYLGPCDTLSNSPSLSHPIHPSPFQYNKREGRGGLSFYFLYTHTQNTVVHTHIHTYKLPARISFSFFFFF